MSLPVDSPEAALQALFLKLLGRTDPRGQPNHASPRRKSTRGSGSRRSGWTPEYRRSLSSAPTRVASFGLKDEDEVVLQEVVPFCEREHITSLGVPQNVLVILRVLEHGLRASILRNVESASTDFDNDSNVATEAPVSFLAAKNGIKRLADIFDGSLSSVIALQGLPVLDEVLGILHRLFRDLSRDSVLPGANRLDGLHVSENVPSEQMEVNHVISDLLRLVIVFTRYSISPAQIHAATLMLGDAQLAVKSKILLMNALRQAASSARPVASLRLDGRTGGVELPIGNSRWPAKGYSLSLWFSVETFEQVDSTEVDYEPRLFSVLTEKGNGLEVFFLSRMNKGKRSRETRLRIRTNQRHTCDVSYNFRPCQWYHFVLTHKYTTFGNMFATGSIVEIFIDGKQVTSRSLNFPTIDTVFSCKAGNSEPFQGAFLSVPDSGLCGELGPLSLFADVLSSSFIEDLWRAGFNYCPNFVDEQTDLLMAKSSAPRIVFAFSPAFATESVVGSEKDNAPDSSRFAAAPASASRAKSWTSAISSLLQSGSQRVSSAAELQVAKPRATPGSTQYEFFNFAKSQADAIRTRSSKIFAHSGSQDLEDVSRSVGLTSLTKTSAMRDTVHSTLDACVFIPLLERMILQKSSSGLESEGITTCVVNAHLGFFGELLWGHAGNCVSIHERHGFAVLAQLLKRVSVQATMETAECVERVIEAAAQAAMKTAALAMGGKADMSDGGIAGTLISSASSGFGLFGSDSRSRGRMSSETAVATVAVGAARAFAAAADALLWDYSIWMDAPFKVQMRIAVAIRTYAMRYRAMFRRSKPSSKAQRALTHTPSFGIRRVLDILGGLLSRSSAEPSSRRPLSSEQIGELRGMFISVMEILASGASPSELQTADNKSPEIQVDDGACAVDTGETSPSSIFSLPIANGVSSLLSRQTPGPEAQDDLATAGVTVSEIRAVVVYVQECGDPHQLQDLLLFLLRQLLWVAPSSDGSMLAREAAVATMSVTYADASTRMRMVDLYQPLPTETSVSAGDLTSRFDAAVGGIEPFWDMIITGGSGYGESGVRTLILRVIGAYMKLLKPNVRAKLLEEYSRALCDERSAFLLDIHSLGALAELLTSRWLFEVGQAELQQHAPLLALLAPDLKTWADGSNTADVETSMIANPQLLPALFLVLSRCEDDELLCQVLQQLVLLTEHDDPALCEIVTNFSGWQLWIIQLLRGQYAKRGASDDFFSSIVCRLGIQLLSRLLRFVFTKKDGFKAVSLTEACVWSQFSGVDGESSLRNDAMRLVNEIFRALISQLKASPDLVPELIGSGAPTSTAILKNVAEFSRILDHFLHNPTIFVHRGVSSEDAVDSVAGSFWQDADLVSDYLLLWDYCVAADPKFVIFRSGALTDVVAKTLIFLTFLQLEEAFVVAHTTLPKGLVEHHSREGSDDLKDALLATSTEILRRGFNRVQKLLVFLLNDNFSAYRSSNASDATPKRLNQQAADVVMWSLNAIFQLLDQAVRLSSSVEESSSDLEMSNVIVRETSPLLSELMRNCTDALEAFLDSAGRTEDHHSFMTGNYFVESSTENILSWFETKWRLCVPASTKVVEAAGNMKQEMLRSRPSESERKKQTDVLGDQEKKDAKLFSSSRDKITLKSAKHRQARAEEEMQRKELALVEQDDANRRTAAAQRKLNRRFAHERSPLGVEVNSRAICNDASEPKRLFYKLDDWENRSRTRLRLTRNYFGSRKAEAAVGRAGESENTDDGKAPHLEAETTGEDVDRLKGISEITLSAIHNTGDSDGGDSDGEFGEDDFETLAEDLEADWGVIASPEAADTLESIEDRVKSRRLAEGDIIFSISCELVSALSRTEGTLVMTPVRLHWMATEASAKRTSVLNHTYKQWDISNITSIQRRRLMLRDKSVEIFFSGKKSRLLDFPEKQARGKFLSALKSLVPPALRPALSQKPANLFKASGYTEKWQNWEMSNFEYLMALNTFAGRTFNDLTQYPVFPWVIADYEGESLDLNDPAIYRDLSKPIGALNQERLDRLRERYESLREVDSETPPFLYGSHYSTLGQVLFFLIRMEPFTSQFVDHVQGGKFDIADRMFHSVEQAWRNCLHSPSDFKELIPEFYSLPEMFENMNGFPLGTRQDGEVVDDVVLPKWAGGSAHKFVSTMRDVLESDYVSQHLHHWIDLIFGFKQLGEAAEAAFNVFYYVTYEGRVDLDKISDPNHRAALEAQIANFGQTPSQLLDRPHPSRGVRPIRAQSFLSRLAESSSAGETGGIGQCHVISKPFPHGVTPKLLSLSSCTVEDIPRDLDSGRRGTGSSSSVELSLRAELLALDTNTFKGRCYDLQLSHVHSRSHKDVNSEEQSERSLQIHSSLSLFPIPKRPFKTPFRDQCTYPVALLYEPSGSDDYVRGRVLVCVSRWDRRCLRVCDPHVTDRGVRKGGPEEVGGGRVLQVITAHTGAITCLTSSVDAPGRHAQLKDEPPHIAPDSLGKYRLLISGGEDACLKVWEWSPGSPKSPAIRVSPHPLHVLRGHRAGIVAVALCEDTDTVVSSALDSVILLHSVRRGAVMRELCHPSRCVARLLTLSSSGDIYAYSAADGALLRWGLNGVLLAQDQAGDSLTILEVSRDGAFLVAAGSQVTVRRTGDLSVVRRLKLALPGATVSSLSLCPDETGLLVCMSNRQLALFAATDDLSLHGKKG